MPLPFTFKYNLPYTNHHTQCMTVTYHIDAVAHDDGFITCRFPDDNWIINKERLYRDVTELAEQEFDKKYERIMQGHDILEKVFDDRTDNNIYAIFILLFILIMLYKP